MSSGQGPKYTAWNKTEREHLNPLIDREMIVGDQIMLARVYIQKGGHVPLHHHHNEQVTYILEGALKFSIDGKEIVVRKYGNGFAVGLMTPERRSRRGRKPKSAS